MGPSCSLGRLFLDCFELFFGFGLVWPLLVLFGPLVVLLQAVLLVAVGLSGLCRQWSIDSFLRL